MPENSKPKDPKYGYDTTVQCEKCGTKQHLNFENGLKNGWSECCGKIMPIIACTANIDEAVKKIFPPLKLKMCRVGKHEYDAFCHCRECEAHRKFDAELNEMKFVRR